MLECILHMKQLPKPKSQPDKLTLGHNIDLQDLGIMTETSNNLSQNMQTSHNSQEEEPI